MKPGVHITVNSWFDTMLPFDGDVIVPGVIARTKSQCPYSQISPGAQDGPQ